jgi:UPF0755 protein
MSRKLKILFFSLPISCLFLFYAFYRSILPAGQTLSFDVPKGSGVLKIEKIINQSLEANGHAHLWPYLFYLDFYLAGQMQGIKAGYYELNGPLNLSALRSELISGKSAQSKPLTIIEGWTKWHIADLLEFYQIVDRKAFLDEIQWEESRGNLIEGKLFPDTYRFPLHAKPKEIIDIFLKQFKKQWQNLIDQYPDRIDLKNQNEQNRIIKIASLVERESSLTSERKTIARVFWNRLEKGMKLQTDPSCVYHELYYQHAPKADHCHRLNPKYSTYVIEGLPPTAIANPGIASIEATLFPDMSDEAKNYLFFVAKRDGTKAHFFSADYQTHKQAVENYLMKDQQKHLIQEQGGGQQTGTGHGVEVWKGKKK